MRKTVQIKELIKKEFPNLMLPDQVILNIETYLDLLSLWNTKINLTAIRDKEAMLVKHVLDSLVVFNIQSLIPIDLLNVTRVMDFGSGAGIPGILLAMCNPNLDLVSVDKSKKKIAFQDQVVRKLSLVNVKPVQNRLEELLHLPENKMTYDIIISRAFDQIKNILYLGQFFLKSGGYLILWKGAKWQEELAEADQTTLNNYQVSLVHRYQFEEFNHGGVILIIQKIN